jgi:hypothetical protein
MNGRWDQSSLFGSSLMSLFSEIMIFRLRSYLENLWNEYMAAGNHNRRPVRILLAVCDAA